MTDLNTNRAAEAARNLFPAYFLWKLAGIFLVIGSMVVGGVWFVVGQSIDGLKVAIETQNGRIGAVEASVLEGRSELNGRFDSQTAAIEGRFNSIDGRFDSLQSQNSTLLSEVRVLGEKVQNLTTAVEKSGYVVPTIPRQGFRGIVYAYMPDGGNLTQQQKQTLVLMGFKAAIDRSSEGPLFDFLVEMMGGGDFTDRDMVLISDWPIDLNLAPPTQIAWDADYGLRAYYQAFFSEAGLEAGFVAPASVGLPQEVGEVFVVGRRVIELPVGTPVNVSDLTSENLTGARVYSADGEDVGEVSNVILGEDGKSQILVIDVGGFLGLGEQSIAKTLDELSVQRADSEDDIRVYLDITEERLEQLPTFEN